MGSKKNSMNGHRQPPSLMKVIERYEPDKTMKGNRGKLIAAGLHYLRNELPKAWITAPLLAKMIYQRTRAPRPNDPDVEGIKSSMASAKIIYAQTYGNVITSLPGLGYRATIDSEDTAATEMIRSTERALSGLRSQRRVYDQIDLKEVNDPVVRVYMTKGVVPHIKANELHMSNLPMLIARARGEEDPAEK